MSTEPRVLILVVLALGLMGLLVGSFLNVVIARVPLGQSVLAPASACPACGSAIRWRDNVPVASWLILRGRCRDCSAPISARYPIVELGTSVLWMVLAAWALTTSDASGLLPLLLVLASAGLALAVIDGHYHRLPDALVLPLIGVTVVGLLVSQAVSGTGHWIGALAGAAIWLAVIGGLWLVTGGRGMGLGDVKLAPVLGATLGWISVGSAVIGLLAAFVLGACVGLALIAGHRVERRTRIAFGPFLLAGALVCVLAGVPLWTMYTRVSGIS
ncbi:MAG: prepilin peptidase [Candidatus Nanopelagicales bacterium]|nr:prepilin peptidase [Candidatus Nanopelagicales bacterium]